MRPISHGTPTTAIHIATTALESSAVAAHHLERQKRSGNALNSAQTGRSCRVKSCTQVNDAENPISATGGRTTKVEKDSTFDNAPSTRLTETAT